MSLKSIFDAIYVDRLIQKNERGETVVYPHGIIGRGYRLPEGGEPTYRRRARTVMLVSLTAGVAYAILLVRLAESNRTVSPLGWVVLVAIAALLMAAIVGVQSRLAKGLEPEGGPRLSLADWMRRSRQSRPKWAHAFSIACGLLFAAGGIAAAALDPGVVNNGTTVLALAALLIGIFGIVDGLLGLIEHTRGV